MIAVIFEVWPTENGGREAYLDLAVKLKADLERIDGFISVERFESIFEHGADVFDLKKGRRAKAVESAKDAKIAKLEAVVAQKDAKIAQKNEVISELMEENILAKKASGEP